MSKAFFYYPSGAICVNQYQGKKMVGTGVVYSKDRKTAWQFEEGRPVGEVTVKEASEICAAVGLPVPSVNSAKGGYTS